MSDERIVEGALSDVALEALGRATTPTAMTQASRDHAALIARNAIKAMQDDLERLQRDKLEWDESQRLFEVEVIPRLESERDAAREKVAQLKAALRLAQRQISSGVGLDPARKVVLDAIQEALSG